MLADIVVDFEKRHNGFLLFFFAGARSTEKTRWRSHDCAALRVRLPLALRSAQSRKSKIPTRTSAAFTSYIAFLPLL
ncbi:hypothetical protein SD81_006930 [Tolypothrix campylonemoides VB511288]|nr:hypothetical protein SD81_006930 [Tolypothrix campylonemoides VB511288]